MQPQRGLPIKQCGAKKNGIAKAMPFFSFLPFSGKPTIAKSFHHAHVRRMKFCIQQVWKHYPKQSRGKNHSRIFPLQTECIDTGIPFQFLYAYSFTYIEDRKEVPFASNRASPP